MKEQVISSMPLFASLPHSEIQHLAETLRTVEFETSTILFHEGESEGGFYILIDGQVEIIKSVELVDFRQDKRLAALRAIDLLAEPAAVLEVQLGGAVSAADGDLGHGCLPRYARSRRVRINVSVPTRASGLDQRKRKSKTPLRCAEKCITITKLFTQPDELKRLLNQSTACPTWFDDVQPWSWGLDQGRRMFQ